MLIFSSSILAIGVAFMDLKVSRRLVWHFLTLVPLWKTVVLSEMVSCMAMTTSAKGALEAALTAPMRFVAASELGRSADLWEPTSITGAGSSCSAKLSAADVYAIVSVPWATTTPATPSLMCLAMVFAVSVQCFGVMFSLKRLKRIWASMVAICESSGTTL